MTTVVPPTWHSSCIHQNVDYRFFVTSPIQGYLRRNCSILLTVLCSPSSRAMLRQISFVWSGSEAYSSAFIPPPPIATHFLFTGKYVVLDTNLDGAPAVLQLAYEGKSQQLWMIKEFKNSKLSQTLHRKFLEQNASSRKHHARERVNPKPDL